MQLQSERRGSALLMAVVATFVIGLGAVLTLSLASTSYRAVAEDGRGEQAELIAHNGVVLVRAFIRDLAEKQTSLGPRPFVGYDSLHLRDVLGGVRSIYADVDLDGNNELVGEVAVSAYVLGADPGGSDGRWVDPLGLHSHAGRVPSVYLTPPTGAAAGQPRHRRDVVFFVTGAVPSLDDPARSVVTKEIAFRVELGASEVFDYAYFMHNWGWMAGTTRWDFNGNVRSNANFSWLGGSNLRGSPRFDYSEGVVLTDGNRMDDNGDADLTNDGGTYAFREVFGDTAGGTQKDSYDQNNVDLSANQLHPGQITLPNINDQSFYDVLAGDHVRQYDDAGDPLTAVDPANTGARVGVYDPSDPAADPTTGYVFYENVIGDDEAQPNVVLVGDASHPIVIDGPVVVRGSVIIRGPIKGQGALYAGDDIYVAGNIEYVNAPPTKRPDSNSTADINAWRQDNKGRDVLGLFSSESIFFGKGSASTGYFNSSDNENAEASAGLDQTNNTGDDDDGAGSGVWEVEYYTESVIALLNPDLDGDGAPGDDPAGPQIGDVVPGSGEDVDSDGVEDTRLSPADLGLPGLAAPPNTFGIGDSQFGGQEVLDTHWLGASRLGAGSNPRYRDGAEDANYVDAVCYSNHFLVGSLRGGSKTRVNGALVGRNEALYAGADFDINHDARLLGGGSDLGFYLPREWKDPRVLYLRSTSGLE